MTVNSEHTTAFRETLRQWYQNGARDLPWRASSDSYLVWISEIMLQQTRVDQALPYFTRFVSAFPDVQSLASAELDEVLRLWEGLGYYSRARNLHRAAKQVVANHEGQFPLSMTSALSLPGIGLYTAAAITSIAFGAAEAAVDGNVSRVLSRVFGIEEDIKSGPVQRKIRTLAQEVLDPEHPGDFNQSLMELGAMICTPKTPTCSACPLSRVCMAHRHNMTELIPATKPRKPTARFNIAVGVILDEHARVLLVQRPATGLLGGLWEFPGARAVADEPLVETCRRGVMEKLGLDVMPVLELTTFDHQFSHFGITMHAFDCIVQPDGCIADSAVTHRWVPFRELRDFAMHKSARRISNLVEAGKFEPVSTTDVH